MMRMLDHNDARVVEQLFRIAIARRIMEKRSPSIRSVWYWILRTSTAKTNCLPTSGPGRSGLRQFLGEGARDTKDRGAAYMCAGPTPSDFTLSELAERTHLIEPVAGSKNELLIETTMSNACSTFDKRRVLSLAPEQGTDNNHP